MTTLRRSLFLGVLLAVGGVGCSERQTPADSSALGPGQVATVDGEPIPESLFRFYAMNANKNADDLTPEERAAVIEDLVRLKLLANAAQERGLLSERMVAAEIELQRLQLSARAIALRHIEENPASPAELQALYDENLARLTGTQYKARHILVESKEEASSVIEQLRGGADFLALAEERSSGPTGPNGGDLGWFSADSMVQPIADAVRSMEIGTFSSEPVQTDFGYHVILLEDTRAQEPPTLDAVRAELTNAVDRRKLEEFIATLREAATVQVE